LAAIFLFMILFVPPQVFGCFVLLLVFGGVYELMRLAQPRGGLYSWSAVAYSLAVSAAMLFFSNPLIFLAVLLMGLFVVALIYMKRSTTLEGLTGRLGLAVFGAVYIGTTLPFWAFLRDVYDGRALVILGIATAAMNDTFAMFGGRLFGRHKFAPLTSPNKTWEGFFAGLVGSILTVLLIKLIWLKWLPMVHVMGLGILIGITGPFGDLIESLIKRDHHVKDSGTIIPGHGGVLDRLDAMIFTGPAVFLYYQLLLL
jgi:phosphatidate cytidylyltransferase